MGSRLTSTMRGGLLVPDPRTINATYLAPVGAGATDSSYSEAGPRPGSARTTDPFAKLRPLVTGGQDTDIEARVTAGGFPSRGTPRENAGGGGLSGLQMAWKESGAADSAYRGWNPPVLAAGWMPAEWSTSIVRDKFDACLIPSTQVVVLVYMTPSVGVRCRRLDLGVQPLAWSSETVVRDGLTTTGGSGALTLLHIPGSERLLAIVWDGVNSTTIAGALDVSASDDGGVTWFRYARWAYPTSPFGGTVDPSRLRAAYQPVTGTIALIMEQEGSPSPNIIVQLASSDLAQTWTSVHGTGTPSLAAWGRFSSVFALPGSAFGVVYMRSTVADTPHFARLGSAYEDLEDVVNTQIAAVSLRTCAAYIESDGAIMMLGGRSVSDEIPVHSSYDLGTTWDDLSTEDLYTQGSTTDYLDNFVALSASGRGLLFANWVATTSTTDGSIGCLILGGWSNLTISRAAPGQQHLAFGGQTAEFATDRARIWLPIELPEDVVGAAWARAGTAPTLQSPGEMRILTAAATTIHTHGPWTTTLLTGVGLLQVKVVSGPAAATTDEIAVEFRFANGVNDREARIQFGTGAFSVLDVNGAATLGTATIDLTTPLMIAWNMAASGVFSTWYWRPGQSLVTAGPTGTLTNDTTTPNATSQVRWGHLASTTAETRWSLMAWRTHNTSQDGQLYGLYGTAIEGRAISAAPYPIPDVGPVTAHAFLAAQAGPGRFGDLWDIDAEHDYPIDHALIGLHPSTRKVWRSVDKTEQRIVFALAAQDTILGTSYSIGIALLGANFNSCVLEGWDGAAWITLATPSFSAVTGTHTLDGETYRPTAAGAIVRQVRHGEATDGGYLLLAGAPFKARTIAAHGAGWLTANTTAKPTFRFDGYDGTEYASPLIAVVVRSAVVIVHLAAGTHYQKYQIRITASQITPYTYYQLGGIVLGSLVLPGQRPSNGWEKRLVPNVEETVSRSGERRVRELGPPVWEWAWSWVEGMLHSRLTADGNYRGSSVGAPLVQGQDVGRLIAGLFRHDLRSGTIPVVGLETTDDATQGVPGGPPSTTAPDDWCYGLLSGPVQTTQVQGDDNAPELVRVESILIRGLP